MFAFVHYEAIVVHERDVPLVAACFLFSWMLMSERLKAEKKKKEFSLEVNKRKLQIEERKEKELKLKRIKPEKVSRIASCSVCNLAVIAESYCAEFTARSELVDSADRRTFSTALKRTVWQYFGLFIGALRSFYSLFSLHMLSSFASRYLI